VTWRDGQITEAMVRADHAGRFRIAVGGTAEPVEAELAAGEQRRLV
jgi:hypothetical protein